MSSFLKGLNNLFTTYISCYSLYSHQVGSLDAQEPFMFMFTFRPFSGCTSYIDLHWPPPSPCQITLKLITSKSILFVPQTSILPFVHYLLIFICVKSQHSNWMRIFDGSAHVCTFLQPFCSLCQTRITGISFSVYPYHCLNWVLENR